MPDVLRIVPSSVELKAGDSQAFEARDQNGAVLNVTWSTADGNGGTIEEGTGLFRAPRQIYKARRIAVLARRLDDQKVTTQGAAVVDLDPSRSWVPIFGGLWIGLFSALVTVLLFFWTELCPQCAPPRLLISPPIVTLSAGQGQQFVASAAATWTNTVVIRLPREVGMLP